MSIAVRRVLIFGLLSLVAYPFSYAPVYRCLVGSDAQMTWSRTIGPWEPLYMPLLAVTDSSGPFLRGWFLRWSAVWDVEDHHRFDTLRRRTGLFLITPGAALLSGPEEDLLLDP